MTRNWLVRFELRRPDLAGVSGVLSSWAQNDGKGRSWRAHSAGIVHGAVLVEATAAEPVCLATLERLLGALQGAQVIAAARDASVAA